MATQAERSAQMRARWIEVGRGLFGHQGFEATPTSALLEAAGASKGALYHHFSSKQALFEAVFLEVSREAIARALARTGTGLGARKGGREQLLQAALAWLDEVRDPYVARILLEEGPRVLGFERARELEAETSLGLMIRSLESAALAGEIQVPHVEVMARMLNAVLGEAALIELRNPDAPREQVEASLRRLLEGLGR